MPEYVTIVVYVPADHTAPMRRAMCEAGAGTVEDGRYEGVTYVSPVTCTFRPLAGARPGQKIAGVEQQSREDRIETICRLDRVPTVIDAICWVHPYETPAITVLPNLTGEFRYWKESPQ